MWCYKKNYPVSWGLRPILTLGKSCELLILQDRGVIRLSISQMIGIPFSENARHTESRTAFQLLAFAKDRLWADLGGFAQSSRQR